jgi:hypothetical protein
VISSHEPSVLASHPGVTIGRSRSRNLASFNELAEAAYLKACVSPFSAPHETLRNNRFPVLTSLFSTAKGATLRLFFKATERLLLARSVVRTPARHTVGLSSPFSRIVSCQKLLFLRLHVNSRTRAVIMVIMPLDNCRRYARCRPFIDRMNLGRTLEADWRRSNICAFDDQCDKEC